ncbi:hypothetical protein L6452_17612 [Arctium lappa]|uniref:Uncharacterized protein n=1 Tax=Arctium lappa TaxID=4217 RepID=A0ACB9C464_ARCLA|nr:hypothetical protein L6452_17612 [Arctium lappa]
MGYMVKSPLGLSIWQIAKRSSRGFSGRINRFWLNATLLHRRRIKLFSFITSRRRSARNHRHRSHAQPLCRLGAERLSIRTGGCVLRQQKEH